MFGTVCYRTPPGSSLSGGGVGRGDFLPDREAVGHLGTPFGRRESVPVGPEMRSHAAEGGQESLCVPR